MEDNKSVPTLDLELRAADNKDDNVTVNLEEECSKLEETFGAHQISLLDDLKTKINMFVQQKISESNKRFQDDIKKLKVCLNNFFFI